MHLWTAAISMPPLSTFLLLARPRQSYKQNHADSLLARAILGPTSGVHFKLRTGTARVAVDALIAALAVGQKCVEGVRRLQTATAGVLLRSAGAPSASWVRRVLGYLAGEGGAAVNPLQAG